MSLHSLYSLLSAMFKRRNSKELLLKNIELLYGYPLYWISFLFSRDREKWLIGSHIGFAGNSKFFFIEEIVDKKKEKCYWIASTQQECSAIRSLKLPAYYRWSVKGIYHSLTSGVYIFSFHLIDVNFWTSGNVKRVNLWHGVGIKNIEFKSHKGSAATIYDDRNIVARIYFPYLFKRPHLFLSTSPLMTMHFKECFRITDEACMESVYPRCQLFTWEKDKLECFVSKYESQESVLLIDQLKCYNKVYLYMPTWRETKEDFIVTAGFDFERLNIALKQKNSVFLLKLHPESNLSGYTLENYSNIISLNKKIDIYPILPFTHVLITDYSSIYYDYILMKDKQVLLFPFDYESYISNNRDLAFDFDDYTLGKRVYTFDELLNCIENNILLEFEQREWIIEQFWGNHSICNLNDKIRNIG